MLSIVIPSLDASSTLPATVESLRAGEHDLASMEILMADGGSTDRTADIARDLGLRVIESEAGRGPQLAAGARAAGGDWLLFLHADTRLSPNWGRVVAQFMAAKRGRDQAGVFQFRLDDDHGVARLLERVVSWRTRYLALPYGDQGLLISRDFYERLGGFKPVPLMEDVDIVRRIGRDRLRRLDATAVTSATRYRQGYIRRMSRNVLCLSLYFLGVAPARLLKIYR